jgi:peptide/nickel transport system permease protein
MTGTGTPTQRAASGPLAGVGALWRKRWAQAREKDLVRSFLDSRLATGAALALLMVAGGALLAPVLAPQNPYDLASLSLANASLPPAWTGAGDARFLLGTDDQGRDILSAVLYGTRSSLLIGLCSVLLASAIGVTLGLWAGYAGGRVGALNKRLADVQHKFTPNRTARQIDGAALAIFKSYQMEGNRFAVLIIAIGLAGWVQYARTVRSATLVERNKDYVAAAQLIGLGPLRIMFHHILPNTLAPVLVLATINLALAIVTEATLSFLGVGLPPSQPSLGTMIQVGNKYLFSGAWWMVAFPGLTLALLALAVNLLGDWLRDALNPKLKP